jgi:hypothetical protein
MKDMWKGLKHCDTAVDFGASSGFGEVKMGEITICQLQGTASNLIATARTLAGEYADTAD